MITKPNRFLKPVRFRSKLICYFITEFYKHKKTAIQRTTVYIIIFLTLTLLFRSDSSADLQIHLSYGSGELFPLKTELPQASILS